jgi:hypothetical protein
MQYDVDVGFFGKKVVLLITGCRIDLKTLKKFLEV